jgi:glycolate oxidase iron-sulfur subunit
VKSALKTPDPFLDESQALACIHCGLCLGSCPTYLETGNENDSPRGRIYLMRAFQDGRLPLAEPGVKHVDLCLGCRACEAACPSGVQYGALLESTRDHIEREYQRGFFQNLLRRVLIERIFPFRRRLGLALLPARFIRLLRLEKWLPRSVREMLLLIPDHPREVSMPEYLPALSAFKKGQVGFIEGCVMKVMFGDTNSASVQLLNRAGYDVLTPRGQGCCGALYSHGGNLERARQCARHNIELFENLGVHSIVINAAGCGSTLKEYGHLLHHEPEWAERARAFSSRVKDLSEFLACNHSLTPSISPANPTPSGTDDISVTYHDACHLAHPQGIRRQPRQLLREKVGDRLVELPEADLCCGSAGTYNLTEPAMAERLQRRKIANILKTGAQLVVTTNPGCILQMRAGLKKAGADHIQVVHLADFLAARMNSSSNSD